MRITENDPRKLLYDSDSLKKQKPIQKSHIYHLFDGLVSSNVGSNEKMHIKLLSEQKEILQRSKIKINSQISSEKIKSGPYAFCFSSKEHAICAIALQVDITKGEKIFLLEVLGDIFYNDLEIRRRNPNSERLKI